MDTYENKYKEAKKWIESIYSELSHEQQTEAEAFFPELKESDDERIRKEILGLVRYTKGRRIGYEPRITQDKMITWLEKQGNESINIDIESMVSSYEQRLKSQGQGNLENNPLINMCVSAFRRGVENTLEELNLKKLEKQGEQKPTNEEMIEALRTEYEKGRADAIAEMQVAWSEEDERICRAIVADIANDKSICKFEISKSICDEQINWLKSLKNRITWKPSEQQMNAIKIAIAYMTDECETPTAPKVLCELLEQLKKLTE